MENEKQFDAVKLMRQIRDKLSKKFMNMTYQQQKEYIKEKIKKTKTLHIPQK